MAIIARSLEQPLTFQSIACLYETRAVSRDGVNSFQFNAMGVAILATLRNSIATFKVWPYEMASRQHSDIVT